MKTTTTSTTTRSSSSSFSLLTKILILVVLSQWGFCLYLLAERDHLPHVENSSKVRTRADPSIAPPPLPLLNTTTNASLDDDSDDDNDNNLVPGVALLLILRRPRWYYKRYNVLVDNALANIPHHWKLQIMYARKFFLTEVLDYHRGLKRLFVQNHNYTATTTSTTSTTSTTTSRQRRILWTELPPHLIRRKPNQVWKDPWIWQHVAADRVLTVHGDGVLCANAEKDWSAFDHLDYVGVPWQKFSGVGGDGLSHSLRNRRAVLAALEYASNQTAASGNEERRNDVQLVKTLLRMNEERQQHSEQSLFQLATPEETEWFGGTKNLLMHPHNGTLIKDPSYGPRVVTGTLPDLSQAARNWVLGTCPELKAIFPSLHHPSCFGAKPDPVQCAQVTLGIDVAEVTGKNNTSCKENDTKNSTSKP